MIITEKQLIILYDIAKWYITYDFVRFGAPYTNQIVIDVLNQIINQQSDKPVEIK